MEKIIKWNQFTDNSLYHFSKEKYSSLLSLGEQIKRGNWKESEKLIKSEKSIEYESLPYKYREHISLFFTIPPLDIIKEKYDPENFFNTYPYYQYEIDINKINLKYFEVMESTNEQKFWDSGKGNTIEEFKKLRKIKLNNGDAGYDIKSLKKCMIKYKNNIDQYYESFIRRSDYYNLTKEYYAIYIPHLFIFPTDGEIIVKKITKINE